MHEAIDVAQNRPLWRLMSIRLALYAFLVMLATTEDEEEDLSQL